MNLPVGFLEGPQGKILCSQLLAPMEDQNFEVQQWPLQNYTFRKHVDLLSLWWYLWYSPDLQSKFLYN